MQLRYLLHTTVLCGLAFSPAIALANPAGGSVVGGSASISSSGNTLTVQQTSNRAIINWGSFDINSGETTQFQQPGSSSIALNRINENSPSQINGQLTANGNIILVNPNGVLFGAGAQVNVNNLVVSTADTDNTAFMNGGKLSFNTPGNPNAQIINQGAITVGQAGLVGLVAPHVENQGIITATLGRVQLASGDGFTLDMAGDGITQVTVSGSMAQELVKNSGLINAPGGQIQLTAAAAADIVGALVTNTGELRADTFQQQGGTIQLTATNGTVTNSGAINARGQNPGDSGGTVSISAVNVQQDGNINVNGQANGGGVNIAFSNSYTDTPSSSITASGLVGAGGSINVSGANPSTTLTASGTYQATSQSGQGGNITSAAGTVNLQGAALDASGASGGQVTVGFTPASGMTTQGIAIDSATTLRADGNEGAGGSITIDGMTITMSGLASAVGLTQGGTMNVNFDQSYTDTTDATLTVVSASGAGGGVYVEGGDNASVTASGTYVADGGTTGGSINFLAGQDIFLLGAYLSSQGQLGNGGTIRVGTDPVLARRSEDIELDNAELIADSEVSDGGEIDLFGRSSLALRNQTRIKTRGGRSGGRIRIGSDPTTGVRTRNTFIDGNSFLDASSTGDGTGGYVSVLSDGQTTFLGTILATGGPVGGNGGYVETSGENLIATGTVDASAPHGNAGLWLLDPNNIDIEQSSCTGTSCSTANAIQTSLSGGTSVTIQTTTGSITIGGTGSVTIADTYSGGNTVTLTLEAGTDIVMGSGTTTAAISSSSTPLNVVFDADTAAGGGAIVMNSGSSIAANGGYINFGGGSLSGGLPTGTAMGDGTYVNGIYINGATLNAGAGSVALTGTGNPGNWSEGAGVRLSGASITTTSGNITLTGVAGGSGYADGGASPAGGIAVINSSVTTASGAILFTGTTGAVSNGDVGDAIVIYGSGGSSLIQATGSGTITLNGTYTVVGYIDSAVSVQGSSTISVNTGNLSITGTDDATSTSYSQDFGVLISGTVETTGTGDVSITGTGGAKGSFDDYGVYILGGGSVQSTDATGNATQGTITLNGTGGGASNGSTSNNHGVYIGNDGGIAGITGGGSVTTKDGNISITGTADASGAGILIDTSSSVSATGLGAVTLSGTGVAASNQAYGAIAIKSSTLSVASGNLSITGTDTGTDGGWGNENGIYINASTVKSTGSGSVSIAGTGADNGDTGANNFGVFIGGASTISSTSNNITVTGTGGGGTGGWNVGVNMTGGSVVTAASGAISLTGISGTGGSGDYGFYSDNTGVNKIGTSSSPATSGNITLTADTWDITNTSDFAMQTSGNITLQQHTNGTTIGVGSSGVGTLSLKNSGNRSLLCE